MAGFVVVMCGVSGKDARMVEIVVSRAPNLKYQYQLVQASNAMQCDIILVDAQAPTAMSELEVLRQRFGNVTTVFISDDGSRGDSCQRESALTATAPFPATRYPRAVEARSIPLAELAASEMS